MPDKKNAFDLLRILLSLSVFISHGYFLTARGNDEVAFLFSKGQTAFSDLGVTGFFTLSGFLITSSFDRNPNIFRFMLNRILRIFPGFWVCIIITAFVIAPIMFYLNFGGLKGFNYWEADGAFSFVTKNFFLAIGQWGVSNATAKSIYGGSLNGSLWSLYPEMQCYILTVILGVFGLIRKNKAVFLLVLVFVYVIYVVNIYNADAKIGPSLLVLSNARKLYTAYLCGAALYIFRDQLHIDIKGQVFLLLFTILLIRNGGFQIAAPVLIALVLVKGFSSFTLNFKYDISYGLYIYAYPVQQLVFTFWLKALGFAGAQALALLLTVILAFLSCVLVERPFLKLKNWRGKQLDTGISGSV